jgi:hypothetical protein
MEQKRLMWKTIRRSRLRNCPGGHFRNSQPAPAHSLKPLAVTLRAVQTQTILTDLRILTFDTIILQTKKKIR